MRWYPTRAGTGDKMVRVPSRGNWKSCARAVVAAAVSLSVHSNLAAEREDKQINYNSLVKITALSPAKDFECAWEQLNKIAGSSNPSNVSRDSVKHIYVNSNCVIVYLRFPSVYKSKRTKYRVLASPKSVPRPGASTQSILQTDPKQLSQFILEIRPTVVFLH